MGKPKHRRCEICGTVTSRYSHTERQGPFVIKVWVRTPAEEVLTNGGFTAHCREHADEPQP